jgi:predicted MPP superfamily phosphohydrolase
MVPTRVGDITVVGIDFRSHNARGLTRALGDHGDNGGGMLAHSPDAMSLAADVGIAPLLSGHMHEGQVCIGPWSLREKAPGVCRGLFESERSS